MKAILKFNLDEHEDRMSHLRATKSIGMAIVLFEMLYNVRKSLGDNQEGWLEKLIELMEEQGINLDELIE